MPNKHPTSFMSERSLEYLLVPQLIGALMPYCKNAIPISFWKTREGGKVSSHLHSHKRIRVIALFARRPKLAAGSAIIHGKINHEVSRFAQASKSYGIPAIAGFCSANSLFDLEPDSAYWIPLEQEDPSKDCLFHQDSGANTLIRSDGSVMDTIPADSLAEVILSQAEEIAFDQAVYTMSELRHELSDFSFFMGGFGLAYKPVYLLVEL